MKINLTKVVGLMLFIICFSYLFSNDALAESISVTISGPGEGLVNEELSYSVDTKEEWVIESADWEFGDGTSSSGISVSHTYSNTGSNTVRVTVEASKEITNEDGSIDHEHETQSDTKKVTVKGVLSISANPKELSNDDESTSTISVSTLDVSGNPFNCKRDIELSVSESGDSNDNNDLPSLPNLPSFPRRLGKAGSSGNASSSSNILSLGPLEMNEDGSRTATATAGTKAGTAKIKAKGSYLSSASCTIKVKESKDRKLSISASPDILPADGKSQITIKVLDEDGNVATSYNGIVNLQSSNASALKVPDSVNVKDGEGSAKAKAGSSAAEVTITVSSDGLESASCKVTVFKVTLSVDNAYIAAESDWTGIDNSYQEALITVNIQPKSAEDKIADKITLKILKVTGGGGYNPGKGELKQSTKNSNLWKYIPFKEVDSEKHPMTKTAEIVALFDKSQCSNIIIIHVKSVFLFLTTGSGFDYNKAIEYTKYKYNMSTDKLTSITYSVALSGKRRGEVRVGVSGVGRYCKLGPGAFESENICASVLGHENVHGGQHWWLFMPNMEAQAEIPAYTWELNNAGRTGIDSSYKSECRAWINFFKGKGPKPQ
jgi:hypothetical protein